MKNAQNRPRVFLIWIVLSMGILASFLLPSQDFLFSSFAVNSIFLLLLILAISLTLHEPNKKNRFVFLNFVFWFGISSMFHLYNFVGTVVFVDEPYARLFASQYSYAAYGFFMCLAVVYLTIDVLMRDFSTVKKYLISMLIVGSFFGYYYGPYFSNPLYLYTTTDMMDWKMLDESMARYRTEHGVNPTEEQLAAQTDMYSWRDGEAIGVLYHAEKVNRINELYPYLTGSNYLTLLWRPHYLNVIHMCVLCLGFILLFFGYQYMKDPPQGAYIDKIMFMLLIHCTLEILHAWSFIKSVEWQTLFEIMRVGQYVSIAVLLGTALLFGLRLRFITSAKGEFYEQEIASSPAGITRWRDGVDNLLISHFFDRKQVLGRLFVSMRRQG